MLGTIDVVTDAGTEAITSRNQRAVLAVLAARAGSVVPTDVLIDALWPDGAPRTASSTMRTYVSRLRRLVGNAIAGTAGGYRLDLSAEELDLRRFEQLLEVADGAAPTNALAAVEEALGLWRGAPFGDVDDLEPVRSTATRLRERWLGALEDRARLLLTTGRAGPAAAAAEELLIEHPEREQTWTVLVDALAAGGRSAEALRAYRRAASALADAGLEVSPGLRSAEGRALAQAVPEPVPVRPVTPPASSLVGREELRAGLRDAIHSHRLVTLIGPGGVGKTRLARTVAADLQHGFTWGVRMVELAGIEDARWVADAIAGDLGLSVGPDGPRTALRNAGALDVLVVVDNCEHVVAAAADAIAALLAGGTGARVLATSREPLAIDGEQLWPLPCLAPGGSADELFLDRARAVRPGYEPAPEERAVITSVVERLDGLPLAIEMAAATLRVLPLAELSQRLESEAGLPAPARRDVDERHRTLDALVGWSVRLLDEHEGSLFGTLSAFTGWVDADDVARVAGHASPLDLLCRLADRSLLLNDASGTVARFRMLRTVRAVAAAGVGEGMHELQASHATWIADEIAVADRLLRGPEELVGHRRIEQLLDDARSALTWSAEHHPALALQIAGRLYLFGQSRLREEVLDWSSEMVARSAAAPDDPGWALVLTAHAHRLTNAGDLETARSSATRAAALGDESVRAAALEVLSDIEMFSGDLDAAAHTAYEALGAARRSGDPHGQMLAVANMVLTAAYRGDHDAAAAAMREAPDEAEMAPSDIAWHRYLEGERWLDRRPVHALAALDEAVALADAVGNRYVVAVARVSAASLRARTTGADDSRAPFAELIAHWTGVGDRTHLLTTLRNLVVLLERLDLTADAAELLGAVTGDDLLPSYGDELQMLEDARVRLGDALGGAELDRLLALGASRSVDEAARRAGDRLAGDVRSGRQTPS